MARSVAAAVVVAALLLMLARVLYGHLFGSDVSTDLPAVDAGHIEQLATHAADAGAGADAGVIHEEAVATLSGVRGVVQVRSPGAEWKDARDNVHLAAADGVRTGRNGEASLQMGNGVVVRLSPRSEFTVREISDEVSKIRLEEGHVTASVDDNGKRVLQVQAKGTDAVAESKGGTFGVVADGNGQLAVATTTGSVKLTALGSTVEVPAGQASSANANTAPSAPRPIPASLFLKVKDLAATKTKEVSTVVAGQTEPGSIVKVGDRPVAVDEKGRFSVKVALKDGTNQIAVDVTDASGRTKTQQLPPVVVDRVKPGIEAETKWGTPQ